MQGKPILRVGKIKKVGACTLGSVEGHLTRSSPTPNADARRTQHNEVLHGDSSQSLKAAVHAVYAKYGIDPKRLRKDATVANDIVMTISPEWFRPDDPDAAGQYDLNRLKVFKAEAMAFLKKGFGDRLVRVDLHLDEATPHIHAIVVPVLPREDKKGFRLSGNDMFNPQALTAMQQGWEDRMSKHGVGQRLKRSTATHRKLKDYYSAVASQEVWEHINVQIQDPPPAKMLQSKAEREAALEAWRKAEQKRVRDELQPFVNEAAKGRLYEAERLTAQAARSDASQSRGRLAHLAEQLATVSDELAMTKEQVTRLRALPVQRVAVALGHDGPIGPKENAIDLVRRIGGLDFKAATAWLHQNMGRDAMAAAITAVAAKETPREAIWTKADYVKRDEMQKQLGALDAPEYRITFVHPNGRRWIFGTSDESPKETHTKEELLARVPEIARQNIQGFNVYVAPISPTQHYLLIDDLSTDGLKELRGLGYAPTNVLETSPRNYQAVLRVPRAGLPEAAVNEFFKDLNKGRGDPRVTGLSHTFRLAGFANRKEKHVDPVTGHAPFVKLKHALNQTCKKSIEVIKYYAEKKLAGITGRDRSRRDKSPTM
jgi:hypothetical protein